MITLQHDDKCAGCGSCSKAPPQPLDESLLSARSVVLGSFAFFLGPIVLAIFAAAIFDDSGGLQLVAAFAALTGGMALAWLMGRLLGFSGEERR